MSATWKSYPDPHAAAEACAAHIQTLLTKALSTRDSASLAVSGGSTPKLLFQCMALMPFPWSRIHLFFVDERVVPPTDDLSNFKLAHDNLIEPAHLPAANVHRIPGELEPAAAAAAYLRDLDAFFHLQPGQVPHFDVVHHGTGPDAHTASLFPGDPLIEGTTGVATATFSQSKGNWRVTLLPAALLAARHNVFLVAGDDKAEALQHVFSSPYDPLQYPAQRINHDGGDVTWFLDTAAARLLT